MSFRQSSVTLTTAGVSMPPFDAFTLTLSVGDTVETWQFFSHGITGSLRAQWVLTYTDNTRTTLVSGIFTDLST